MQTATLFAAIMTITRAGVIFRARRPGHEKGDMARPTGDPIAGGVPVSPWTTRGQPAAVGTA